MKFVSTHILTVIAAMLLLPVASRAQEWTLPRLLDTALSQNAGIQMGEKAVELARERRHEAIAHLFPKVTVNADYRYFTDLPYQLMPMEVFGGPAGQYRETQFGVPHNIGINAQLAMPLFNPNIIGGIGVADVAGGLSGAHADAAREQVAHDVSALYYGILLLNAQLAITDSNITNVRTLTEKVTLLYGQGMATGADLARVTMQEERLVAMRQTIISKREQALYSMRLLAGIDTDAPMEITAMSDAVLPALTEGRGGSIPSDVRISRSESAIAAAEFRASRLTLLPSLTAVGSYGTTGFGYTGDPEKFLNFYPIGFVGVQFSYPLFNGTVTYRRIRQKKLELERSLVQAQLAESRNLTESKRTEEQRKIALANLEAGEGQVRQARTLYRQLTLQYAEGLTTLTDVLLADNGIREAQQLRLSAMNDLLLAELSLRKLQGRLITE